MADSPHPEANPQANHSDMDVAYQLYLDVAYAENMDVRGVQNPNGEKASRNWILRTFTWCYRQVQRAKTGE